MEAMRKAQITVPVEGRILWNANPNKISFIKVVKPETSR